MNSKPKKRRMTPFIFEYLPLSIDCDTKAILKKMIAANRARARLNGVAKIIPNQAILINSLILQEAKDRINGDRLN